MSKFHKMTEAKATFDEWLNSWSRFSSYVHASVYGDNEDYEAKKTKLIELMGDLTHFYHYNLIPAHPQMPIIPAISRQEEFSSSFLARKHFYVQWKIFRLQSKHLTRAIQFIDELVTKMQSMLVDSSKFEIQIDTEGFYKQCLSESPKCTQLIKLDCILVNQITQQETLAAINATESTIIHQILYGMTQYFDRNAMFIQYHPLQDTFDQTIFKPTFEFYIDVMELINPQNMTKESAFTNNIIHTMHKIIRKYQIFDAIETAIFSIIFFRSIYNRSVVYNEEFFTKHFPADFRSCASKATVEMIGAPPELVPKGTDVSKLVHQEDLLNQAGKLLTSLPYYTSPLDMLGCIHESLSLVRDYATAHSENKKEDVHSFDSIFGLFMVTLVGCDLVNVEEVFWFINSFSPMDGLSGQLEYARATAAAVLMQAAHIVASTKEQEENDPNL